MSEQQTSNDDRFSGLRELVYTDYGPNPEDAPQDATFNLEAARGRLRRKWLAEVLIVLLGLPVWFPVVAACAVLLLVTNGRPVFYRSTRRVYRSECTTILKFRTMVPNAAELYNRSTVPVESQRFLNIPLDSPAYTPVGRLVERCNFTELPQLLQVFTGRMSLVGNRPLPEDVITVLKESFPGVEARFWARSGVIGAAQLVGREELGDEERLQIEIAFARACLRSGAVLLSVRIFVEGILIAAKLKPARDFEYVRELLTR